MPNPSPPVGEVLRLADEIAEKKKGAGERFDIRSYLDRLDGLGSPSYQATYQASSGMWYVHYHREPNRRPGNNFAVSIRDETGETRYIGGL